MAERRCRLADIEVAYTEAGAGPPVVLLHGLAEDRHSFDDVQTRLTDFRSFAVDLRGHGETTLGSAEGTLEQLGGDLVAFLEMLGEPAACVGFSLGGTIVLWAAANRPDLVSRVVPVATSPKVGSAARDFFAQRIDDAEAGGAVFEAALKADTAAQLATSDIDVDALTRRRLATVGDRRGYVNAARAMMALNAAPITPLLDAIRCPVEVIGASEDMFCPRKASDMIVEGAQHARYHEIAGAGHLIGVERPEAYVAALRRALED